MSREGSHRGAAWRLPPSPTRIAPVAARQEALVTALERWPETGIPDNPGAWLMATAKNRAIDLHRRRRMQERKHDVIDEETWGAAPRRPRPRDGPRRERR
jgi:DNA-directed RNA polymerase specialized sigma24 family protein